MASQNRNSRTAQQDRGSNAVKGHESALWPLGSELAIKYAIWPIKTYRTVAKSSQDELDLKWLLSHLTSWLFNVYVPLCLWFYKKKNKKFLISFQSSNCRSGDLPTLPHSRLTAAVGGVSVDKRGVGHVTVALKNGLFLQNRHRGA